jgi:hypothetical protein
MLIMEIGQSRRKLITEQWNDHRWMLIEQKHIAPFVASLEKYITEAQLTPDQIKSLFTSVEKQATDSGSNRTAVGKGVDATKWINNKINELGASLAKSGPVTNLDQKVEDLKTKIAAKDTKTVQVIQSISDWAKANPGKASIAVGVLTAAAAMVGGPLAGAVGGFLSRATKDLLQGSKLSTAVGKSVKTAAIGALAGGVADTVGLGGEPPGATATDTAGSQGYQGYRNADTVGLGGDPAGATATDTATTATDTATTAANSVTFGGSNPFDKDEIIKVAADAAKASGGDEWEIKTAVQNYLIDQPQYASVGNAGTFNDQVNLLIDAGLQGKGALADIASKVTMESIILSQRQVIKLTEGIMDTIKGTGASLAGKAKTSAANVVKKGVGAAQQAGKNITTKITADKLLSAWKKAGAPTDSNKVYQVLKSAGVNDETMEPVFKSMSIPFVKGPPRNAPPAPNTGNTGASAMSMQTPGTGTNSTKSTSNPTTSSTYTQVLGAIDKLSLEQANELIVYIDSLNNKVKSPAQPAGSAPTQAVQPSQKTRQASLDRTAQRKARTQQPAPTAQPTAQPTAKPRIRTAPATSTPVR